MHRFENTAVLALASVSGTFGSQLFVGNFGNNQYCKCLADPNSPLQDGSGICSNALANLNSPYHKPGVSPSSPWVATAQYDGTHQYLMGLWLLVIIIFVGVGIAKLISNCIAACSTPPPADKKGGGPKKGKKAFELKTQHFKKRAKRPKTKTMSRSLEKELTQLSTSNHAKYKVGEKVYGLGVHHDVNGTVTQVTPDATGTGGVVTVEVIKSMNTDTTDDFVPSVRTAFSDFKLAVEREEDGDFEGALSSYEGAWRHLKFLAGDFGEGLTEDSNYKDEELVDVLLHSKFKQVDKRIDQLKKWMDGLDDSMVDNSIEGSVGSQGGNPPPPLQAQTFRKVLNRGGAHTRQKSGIPDPNRVSEEDFIDSMHYTCVCGPPEDFVENNYQLAVQKQRRSINFAVVITMYNEDEVELGSTLRKVAQNVHYICTQPRRHDTLWVHDNDAGVSAEDFWKRVAVFIVSDGRTKVNPATKHFLDESLGCYDEDVMQITSHGLDVTCHLFERSVVMPPTEHEIASGRKLPPLQLTFALKEHNAGKLNSHLWYFRAFCHAVAPTYCLLLDVGTMPVETAIFRLIRSMEQNQNIGGVCGEIAVDQPLTWRSLSNMVIAAQHFEYKISNIMDKAMESVFGFISVLPGAFSGYRLEAIDGPRDQHTPLDAYFKSLTTDPLDLGAFQGNMYLAEDRILCFELIARQDKAWIMHYVKNARAETDVPETLVDLIKQRRRWLNGSFFAILYSLFNFQKFYFESAHPVWRKAMVTLQLSFMWFTVAISWVLVGLFYLTIYYILLNFLQARDNICQFVPLESAGADLGWLQDSLPSILSIVGILYIFCVVIQFVIAMGNKPSTTEVVYQTTMVFFGLVMALTSAMAIAMVSAGGTAFANGVSGNGLETNISSNLQIPSFWLFVGGIGLYFLTAVLHGELIHICATFFQYFFMLPTTVNVLAIYAFCNLQDLSWGTKGLESGGGHGPTKKKKGGYQEMKADAEKEMKAKMEAAKRGELTKDVFASFRSKVVVFWIICNGLVVFLILAFEGNNWFLTFIVALVAFVNAFRFAWSLVFLLQRGALGIVLRSAFCCCGGSERREQVPAQQGMYHGNPTKDLHQPLIS